MENLIRSHPADNQDAPAKYVAKQGYPSGSLESCADSFCKSNALKGELGGVKPGQILGTFRLKIDFITVLAKRLRTRFPIAESRMMTWCEWTHAQLEESLPKLEMAVEPVADTLMWSYVNPKNPTNPFSGLDISHLPCTLGLPNPTAARVAFAHAPSDLDAVKKPTVLDAGIDNLQWIPGGKTKPHSPCSKNCKGLPEFIHHPVRYMDIKLHFIKVI
ncbi:MAG: hypothetical protein WCO56_25150 [Verrucomicrobiota bacterium]